ncbi:hypothetical protein [Yersinia massiliensis]|uniref:hypothetical protein n=1 Tax=Yersinia massiliensis TaxID=419257 RepID=UPI0028D4FFF8|nr:hypothetical protein [Yersinia massiliensis]
MAPLKTESLHPRTSGYTRVRCWLRQAKPCASNHQRTTGFKGCVVLFQVGGSVARLDELTHAARLQLAVRLFVQQRPKLTQIQVVKVF